MRRNADLVMALVLAAVSMLVVLLVPVRGLLVTLVTLPVVLLLPGHVLSTALFPRSEDLDNVERVATVIGLSLAASIFGGLVLHLTPWGLQPSTWAICLTLITWGGSLVALKRRQGLPEASVSPLRWPALNQGLYVAGAALLGLVALVIAVLGATEPRGEPFTQLWLLPHEVDGSPAVQLGVRNMEGIATSYRLVLQADDTVVGEWPRVTLAPGETVESVVTLPQLDDPREIRAELYLLQAPDTVYRQVHLSISRAGQP